MARILIIDDDVLFREMLSSSMLVESHDVSGAGSIAEGRQALSEHAFDLVFLDVGLPDGDGLSLIPVIRQSVTSPEIIIITGDGHADGAEKAINNGALDYISKPSSLASMKQAVNRALTYRTGVRQLREPERAGIIGSSAVMKRCYQQLAEAASSDASVLITGETGTGKELFARAIHQNSERRAGPFVTVDCGAIAKTLTESELFGHEKGAFTGAVRPREGLVLQANGGTLFLDEVGELVFPQQRTFLRVLEDQQFRPVGAQKEVYSNFRLVAATNRSLSDMVRRGTFRKDLQYRLEGTHLALPSLRERLEDLPELAMHFMEKGCDRYGFSCKALNDAYLRELSAYTWPGNVRELLHVVEQSLIRGRFSDELLPEHLPNSIRVAVARSRLCSLNVPAPLDSGGGREVPRWTGEGARDESGEDTPAYLRKADDPPVAIMEDGMAVGEAATPASRWIAGTGEGGSSKGGCSASGVLPEGGDGTEAVAGALPVWKSFRDAALSDVEKCYLERLLAVAGGNIPKASLIAGISRQRLYMMLRKHGIMREWRMNGDSV